MSQALLLAEAEPGTREFLERHLASDGFAVLGASAGRETLELVERERPDLVLVGGLPDAPALEVCRLLREGGPGRPSRRAWARGRRTAARGRAGPLVGPRRAGDRPRRGALVRSRRPRACLPARL